MPHQYDPLTKTDSESQMLTLTRWQ